MVDTARARLALIKAFQNKHFIRTPLILPVFQACQSDFVPIELDEGTPGEVFLEKRGFPEIADKPADVSILTRLAELSEAYGTQIKVDAGGAWFELN